MDIQEIKAEKKKFEETLEKMLMEFIRKTGVKVVRINIGDMEITAANGESYRLLNQVSLDLSI